MPVAYNSLTGTVLYFLRHLNYSKWRGRGVGTDARRSMPNLTVGIRRILCDWVLRQLRIT